LRRPSFAGLGLPPPISGFRPHASIWGQAAFSVGLQTCPIRAIGTMTALLDSFNNRELAVFIWMVLLLGVAFTSSGVRRSAIRLIRALAQAKVLISVVLMLAYLCLVVIILRAVGYWTLPLFKDTIMWALVVASVVFLNMTRAMEDREFFSKTAVDTIKVTAIMEFLVNLYTFPFWVEFLAVPLLILAAVGSAIAERDPKLQQAGKACGCLMALYGLIALAFSMYEAALHPGAVLTSENLRSVLLAPILTVALLPFVYAWATWATYERIFLLLWFLNADPNLVRYAQRRVLKTFHLRLRALNEWSRRAGLLRFESKSDVDERLDRHSPVNPA